MQLCVSLVYVDATVCKSNICRRKCVYLHASVVYVHASVLCLLTSVCKFNICPHKCM